VRRDERFNLYSSVFAPSISCRDRVPSGARKGGAGVAVVSAGVMSPRNVAGKTGAAQSAGEDTCSIGAPSGRWSGKSSCCLSSAAACCCRVEVFCIGSAWRTRRRNDEKNEANEFMCREHQRRKVTALWPRPGIAQQNGRRDHTNPDRYGAFPFRSIARRAS
jgi:hypothetical protein